MLRGCRVRSFRLVVTKVFGCNTPVHCRLSPPLSLDALWSNEVIAVKQDAVERIRKVFRPLDVVFDYSMLYLSQGSGPLSPFTS